MAGRFARPPVSHAPSRSFARPGHVRCCGQALVTAAAVAHLTAESPVPFSSEVPPMTSNRAAAVLVLGLALLPCSPALPDGEQARQPRQKEEEDSKDKGQETPIGPKWWPSEWGADDERGAA